MQSSRHARECGCSRCSSARTPLRASRLGHGQARRTTAYGQCRIVPDPCILAAADLVWRRASELTQYGVTLHGVETSVDGITAHVDYDAETGRIHTALRVLRRAAGVPVYARYSPHRPTLT